MKNRPFLLAFLGGIAALHGADPAPGMVELKACFVRATEEQFHRAMTSAAAETGGILNQERLGKVLTALQADKAGFLGDLRTVTLSGTEAAIASVREFRYPTEFEKDENNPGKVLPKSFETRNVGITAVFQAEIGPAGRITLDVKPEITDFLGFIDYSGAGASLPADDRSLNARVEAPLTPGGIWQPLFYSANLRAKADLASGQTIVLGGASVPPALGSAKIPPKDAEKKERVYVFVTATLPTDH